MMPNRKYVAVTYLTLGDVICSTFSEFSFNYEIFSPHSDSAATSDGFNLRGILYQLNADYNIEDLMILDSPITQLKPQIEHLFILMYAKYWKHYTGYIEGEFTPSRYNQEEMRKYCQEFMIKIVEILQETSFKFIKLLEIYEENKNNLLKKIESLSSGNALFNDTPQEEMIDSSYEDSHYATNITKTIGKNESDGTTLVNRINEINLLIKNQYRDWLNEFSSLFIEEDMI